MPQDRSPTLLFKSLDLSPNGSETHRKASFHVPRSSDYRSCNQRTLPSVDELCNGVLPSYDSTSTLGPSLQALERRINPPPPPRSLSFFNRPTAVADFWVKDQIPQQLEPKIRPQTKIEKLRDRETDTCSYQPSEGSNVIEKQQDEWLQYVFKLEKEDGQQEDDDEGRGQSVYQCRYEDDQGQLCNYRGLKQMVKRHVNSVHLKKRPWACEFCPKRFPQVAEFSSQSISDLILHDSDRNPLSRYTPTVYTYSTGEKPIKCPYCSDKFADPARRHKHVARVHSDKPTKKRRKAPFVQGSSKATPDET